MVLPWGETPGSTAGLYHMDGDRKELLVVLPDQECKIPDLSEKYGFKGFQGIFTREGGQAQISQGAQTTINGKLGRFTLVSPQEGDLLVADRGGHMINAGNILERPGVREDFFGVPHDVGKTVCPPFSAVRALS